MKTNLLVPGDNPICETDGFCPAIKLSNLVSGGKTDPDC